MKTLLIFTLFLISVGGGESGRVMGYSGGGVLIKCRYETQYTSNPKYLCEAPWPCMTKPIWTDAKNEWINRGRFSLFDDTRAAQFWVVIRELTVEDSGTYNCAVDKDLAIDVYTPVELKVEEVHQYMKSISVTGHVGGGVNISCKYPQSHSSNPKFLCRRVGTPDCSYETSVKESRRWRNEGKLSLHDDRAKQIFTVIINSLTEGDSGEYWCGAESDWTSDHGYKVYITQVNLRVTDVDSTPTQGSSNYTDLVAVYSNVEETGNLPDSEARVSTVYSSLSSPTNPSDSSQHIYDNV
ncbi:polymeric immunoglobulin receptor-like isoform X2 [Pygocentrus nattereri]|uniref:polymeric immunoglobulin receptor-like isoform X2 n=1 Tax=Pygocentrus nattereri TaxID=42514 RepID=UPI001890BAED|nr:polymeric immunoglobulin receptor-like isoform X2 [Pygocentrus nattereri]